MGREWRWDRKKVHLWVLAPWVMLQAQDFRTDLLEGRFLLVHKTAEAKLAKKPQDAEAWAAKSQALSSFQRFEEALSAAEKALQCQPGYAEGYLARGLARSGLILRQRNLGAIGRVGSVLDDLRQAVKADPSLVSGWMTLGLAYQQLPGLLGGSTRKALDCAAQLRKVHLARGDLLQGMILAMDSDWKEAESYFAKALTASPGDPEILYGFLEALASRETRHALGEKAQKERLLREAQRLAPLAGKRARALEAVSQAFLEADRAEDAWKTAWEAIPECDAPSTLRLQLGKVAAWSGIHREEALKALEKALSGPMEGGSGGPVAAWWRKGQILKDLGRRSEALACAEAALKLDSKHPGAKKLQKELSS